MMTERDSIMKKMMVRPFDLHEQCHPCEPPCTAVYLASEVEVREAQGTAVIVAQRRRIDELESELREQARLSAMGGEREARLLTRVDELQSALQAAIEDMRAHGIMGRGHPAEEAFRELQR